MKQIMLTGGRPTGKLHLGHYIGAFKSFSDMQDEYQNYFIISDMHMLTTKSTKEEIDKIFENSINMIIDAIGMGINPEKTTFYLQSQIPSLSHIFGIFQNYVRINRVNNTPSLQEMSKHSNSDEVSLGLVAYPVLEAADVFSLNADIIPVGKDNIDHIKIAQEIIAYLNHEFDAGFKIPQYITTENNHIVGLDGNNKMSKSLNNSIYIRDTKAEVNKKIAEIKWIYNNNEAVNVTMEYIKVFAPEIYPNLLKQYNNGKLEESTAKEILSNIINEILEPMRQRMKPYIENKEMVFNILYNGTKIVKDIADKRMMKLKKSIGLVNLEEKIHI